jgi:hypothetical protein
VVVAVTCLCVLLCAAPGSGADIPTLEKVVGPPALGFSPYWGGGLGPFWWIAADDRHIYLAADARVEVFTQSGDWIGFWPVSSAVRGLGEPAYDEREGSVTLSAISGSPWGWVYVGDSAYGAIHIYDQQGSFIGGWGGFGDAPHEIPEGHYLRAISASADESIYVLEWGEWPEASGSIRRFTKEGTFLNSWSTPTAEWPPRWCVAQDVDADATGSVWLLARTYVASGDVLYAEEAWVYEYDVQGNELASWTVPVDAGRIEVERGGYPTDMWVLVSHPSQREILRYRTDGTFQYGVQIDSPWMGDFALDDASDQYIVAQELIPGQDDDYGYASALRIEKWAGRDDTFLDYADMLARGALIAPDGFAVTPQGEVYAKINQLRPDFNYVSHFDPDGALVEVLRTGDWPTYMPDTGTVEFLPRGYEVVDSEGRCYLLEAISEEIGEETVQWLVVATKHTREGDPVGSFTVAGPVAGTASWPAEWARACLGADGNLRLMLAVGDMLRHGQGWEVIGTLWVGVVTPEGEMLSSWVDEGHEGIDLRRANAVAVDPGGNVYVALDETCWKYRPDGQRIGQLGLWGDEGGETASLIYSPAAIHVDDTGRVRVLDSAGLSIQYEYAANHLLVFAHEPGPFSDVPYWHWALDQVATAVGAGIVAGYDDGLYRPDRSVARDQMAAYISRALAGGDDNVPEGPAQPTFADVPPTHWAYDYVEHCAAQAVVEGVSARCYRPGLSVDRGQMAVYIARALVAPEGEDGLADYVPTDPRNFPDVVSDFWAYRHIEYCVEKGVVQGYGDGYYHPEIVVTRDQMAVYVARAFGLVG